MLRTQTLPVRTFNLTTLAVRAVDSLTQMHDRARQRRQLGSLDARMLRDIGISRSDALAEARKPFWQA